MTSTRAAVIGGLLALALALAPVSPAFASGITAAATGGMAATATAFNPVAGLATALVGVAAAIITAPIAILSAVANAPYYGPAPGYPAAPAAYDAATLDPGLLRRCAGSACLLRSAGRGAGLLRPAARSAYYAPPVTGVLQARPSQCITARPSQRITVRPSSHRITGRRRAVAITVPPAAAITVPPAAAITVPPGRGGDGPGGRGGYGSGGQGGYGSSGGGYGSAGHGGTGSRAAAATGGSAAAVTVLRAAAITARRAVPRTFPHPRPIRATGAAQRLPPARRQRPAPGHADLRPPCGIGQLRCQPPQLRVARAGSRAGEPRVRPWRRRRGHQSRAVGSPQRHALAASPDEASEVERRAPRHRLTQRVPESPGRPPRRPSVARPTRRSSASGSSTPRRRCSSPPATAPPRSRPWPNGRGSRSGRSIIVSTTRRRSCGQWSIAPSSACVLRRKCRCSRARTWRQILRRLAALILRAALSAPAIALHRLIVAESARFPELAARGDRARRSRRGHHADRGGAGA